MIPGWHISSARIGGKRDVHDLEVKPELIVMVAGEIVRKSQTSERAGGLGR
jgi:hypothetical protein